MKSFSLSKSLLAIALFVSVASYGCAPGYSTRMNERLKTTLEHVSINTLKAAPNIVRLAGADTTWAGPVASTLEYWSDLLLRSANAALTECVRADLLVQEATAALVRTLVEFGHPNPALWIAAIKPIFDEAVADMWPYPVGHCPHIVED